MGDVPVQSARERISRNPWRSRVGLLLGPAALVAILLVGPPAEVAPGAWNVVALTALMAIWWISEAIPIAATSLLPVALLPLLGVMPIAEAAAPYANPLVFLFLGGFVIAQAIQRWGLHRRIALVILSLVGRRLDALVGGFMAATAGLSMWVSNTATAALMLPIGLSVLGMLEERCPALDARNMAPALLLGIAFSANIGGMATLIGTPPNALLAGYMADTYGVSIGFGQWMVLALPVALIMLGLTWWVLTRWAFPVSCRDIADIQRLLQDQHAELGPMTRAERSVAAVFLLVALAWIARPLLDAWLPGLMLSDAGIAIVGALALFVIPADWGRQQFLMDWEPVRQIPWGVLVLVGGGLSLGSAIDASGLATHLTGLLAGLEAWPTWGLIALVATTAMLLSHVTSNTATAATLVPLTTALALGLAIDPLLLGVPVALAASCAFMLPVATPPNAIVFSSERLQVAQMVRAGSRLSLVGIALITVSVLFLARPVFGLTD
jgi:sodium-dependent dicarboxylate transporter 2/3/5